MANQEDFLTDATQARRDFALIITRLPVEEIVDCWRPIESVGSFLLRAQSQARAESD